jgi:hypothetical protein
LKRPSAFFCIIHMTTFVSQKINILGINFKIREFFTTSLLTQFYVRVDILHPCEKHFHDHTIHWGEVWAYATHLIPHFLLMCLYQARRMICHVISVLRVDFGFPLFLWFFYWILELFWQCGIFWLSFGCYGRTDGSVTISLLNFIGEGIIIKLTIH